MLNDIAILAESVFNWRFLAIAGAIVASALLFPERHLRPFRSVRFNIALFAVIAIVSSIGTFIPQNKPAAEALAKLGPFWTKIFDALGFLDIYHQWWFAALLGLMAFNVVACKLRRLPRLHNGPLDPAHPHFHSTAHLTSQAQLTGAFQVEAGVDAVAGVRSWFSSIGWVAHEAAGEADGTRRVVFSAARRPLQRWGDFLLHVSLVVVLAGNLMGVLFGFEEMVPVVEGETVKMSHRPLSVHLKNFDIEYYQTNGAPSLYASDIEILSDGKPVVESRIIVNEPLDINRVRFYQASWGMTESFRSARIQVGPREFELPAGVAVPLPGTPLSVRANRFLPTFRVGAGGRAETADYEGRNQAVQFDFLKGDAVLARIWALRDDPSIAFRLEEGDRLSHVPPPPFQLTAVDPVLFSGIQVGYDPGAPLFWFGSILLLIGLSINFYMHQRRLRVVVSAGANGSSVVLAGWSSRSGPDLEPEFQDWLDGMRKALGGGEASVERRPR